MRAGARALTLLVLGMPRVLPSRSFDPIWHPPEFPQVADPCVAVGLAQLLVGALHDQWMVEESCWTLTPEQPGEPDLAPGRRQQIDAADHQVDALAEIVHRHGELVGPV